MPVPAGELPPLAEAPASALDPPEFELPAIDLEPPVDDPPPVVDFPPVSPPASLLSTIWLIVAEVEEHPAVSESAPKKDMLSLKWSSGHDCPPPRFVAW